MPALATARKRADGSRTDHRIAVLRALTALGIVYGDLGTSPLYTLQTIIKIVGGKISAPMMIGILSLIFWALTLTISVKYCVFVMRADNNGEGGNPRTDVTTRGEGVWRRTLAANRWSIRRRLDLW
jgi:K+ transporter